MEKQKIIAIVAYDLNRLIGADGDLIWRIPEDMSHFKKTTTGNICVMGRVTWESIDAKYRPLDRRMNIVISTNEKYKLPDADNVMLASSWDHAKEIAHNAELMKDFAGKDIYVCGGARLYETALPDCDQLIVTEIAKEFAVEGLRNPKYFPELENVWIPEPIDTNFLAENGYILDFIRYTRLV